MESIAAEPTPSSTALSLRKMDRWSLRARRAPAEKREGAIGCEHEEAGFNMRAGSVRGDRRQQSKRGNGMTSSSEDMKAGTVGGLWPVAGVAQVLQSKVSGRGSLSFV